MSPDLPLWAEITVSVFLVLGGLFALVGSYGMVKLPDAMTRLHAPTKASTVGVGGVLIASMVYVFATEGRLSVHELLITLFLVLTAPITALFIAKVHMHMRERPETLPAPRDSAGWANFSADAPARGVRDTLPVEPGSPDTSA